MVLGTRERAGVCRALAAGAALAVPWGPAWAADSDSDAIRRELQELRERLSELEALKARVEELEARLAREAGDEVAAKEAVSEAPEESEQGTSAFQVGGALRFNVFWEDYDPDVETKRGDAGLDLFRINVDGEHERLLLSAEYRFYPYMSTIHHGWIGYDFDDAGQVQVGITQVPFGLLPYASHNFWFGVPYYIGLADDYDAGVKYVHARGPWDLQLAFFKNEELGDSANLDRYSYDPVAVGARRNEETNTINARLAYTIGHETECSHEVGLSAQWGELYNRDTRKSGSHWAGAGHLDSRCGRWNVQLELGRYAYDPQNPPGIGDDTVTLGAFQGTHEVASEGTLGVFNVAYNLPVSWPGVKLITCYNDFSVLMKNDERFDNSYLNTTGCGISIGKVFTYVDLIRGRNMVFIGDGSLAGGGSDDWDTRFNINAGYYW